MALSVQLHDGVFSWLSATASPCEVSVVVFYYFMLLYYIMDFPSLWRVFSYGITSIFLSEQFEFSISRGRALHPLSHDFKTQR